MAFHKPLVYFRCTPKPRVPKSVFYKPFGDKMLVFGLRKLTIVLLLFGVLWKVGLANYLAKADEESKDLQGAAHVFE